MFTPNKVLIIRLSSIGDVLLTTPLIRVLKKKYLNCQIDFVIKEEFQELVAYHPFLTKIYAFDKKQGYTALRKIKMQLKEEQYDVIIDLHKNFRSFVLRTGVNAQKIFKFKKHIFNRLLLVKLKFNRYRQIVPLYQRYLDGLKELKLRYDNAGLDLYIPAKLTQKIAKQWSSILEHKYEMIVGFAPGASFITKQWHIEGFIEVANYLVQKLDSAILLFGDKKDKAVTTEIKANFQEKIFDVAGELSLLETAALMNYCDLIITNDTGLMHIASALKKKIVAIFGSTTEELGFFPYATNSIVVENKNLNCRPCSHIGRHKCPKKHFKCMTDIKAQQVIEAINSLIIT